VTAGTPTPDPAPYGGGEHRNEGDLRGRVGPAQTPLHCFSLFPRGGKGDGGDGRCI